MTRDPSLPDLTPTESYWAVLKYEIYRGSEQCPSQGAWEAAPATSGRMASKQKLAWFSEQQAHDGH